jgi:DMSO/TMAO reductase YedYZ molybdopterin-dependent catalytic subunit
MKDEVNHSRFFHPSSFRLHPFFKRYPMVSDPLTPTLLIEGDVEAPASLTFADLSALPESAQVRDVNRLDAKRQGDAVKFSALLALVRPREGVRYLTLHASNDDFHASIPLDSVRDRAILIYRQNGQPLPQSAGGPLRFFIPDFAACHTAEVDECANVKFVDRIELSVERGRDNRPQDENQHAAIHKRKDEK